MKPDFGRYIDHTLLRPIGTTTDIHRLCSEAIEYGMAAVCIFPSYIPIARGLLKDTRVKIATVIAFPFGITFTEIKEAEMRASAARGADETDFVINIAALKSGEDKFVEEELQLVARVPGQAGRREALGDGQGVGDCVRRAGGPIGGRIVERAARGASSRSPRPTRRRAWRS